MTASRERKIEYIKSFGMGNFEALLRRMVSLHGVDFLSDEQIDAMASRQVHDARFNQHWWMRQRPAFRAAAGLVSALQTQETE